MNVWCHLTTTKWGQQNKIKEKRSYYTTKLVIRHHIWFNLIILYSSCLLLFFFTFILFFLRFIYFYQNLICLYFYYMLSMIKGWINILNFFKQKFICIWTLLINKAVIHWIHRSLIKTKLFKVNNFCPDSFFLL